ncbi:serine/threonine-protein phosphatase 2A regulatory subunit B'' subunit gamma-like [Condylostylus longicornis]|uniref:serine/threonine-protein phosphatase 2A regulatory subunit B'' subunit gamma-like n=1 Tax=Condylostylus longicornis TaxID=2530218 RepID=UPI00244E1D53|nr:serine/threonine-protein phosphatase 2A regulatory subunit B'' subunit gamma-like [Condylostylus longicornis]
MDLNSELIDGVCLLLEKALENNSKDKEAGSSVTISPTLAENTNPTYKIIPKFYHKVPKSGDSLAQKLREEARSLFLQKRTKELLDNDELKALWVILEKHHTVLSPTGEQLIGYDDYLKVIENSDRKCQKFLTASLFARLQTSSGYPARVNITSIFNYIMKKVWMQQTRIGLSLYDYTGLGFLRETDLESYIQELIPTLPQLEGLENSFHSFYVCTAVRKFFFFLDPLRTGKIRIRDILASGFLDDLLELRDEENPKDNHYQDKNWFSATSALTVYGHYLNLDKDHNGMLSKEELKHFGSGTLTTVFLDRVFAECLTYDNEMDYKTYLDFVLALENRHEPQSLHYLFRILDVEHQGYLTAFTLQYFFKGIQEQIIAHKSEQVNFEDVKDEIFDMVKSVDPTKITLKDLINCGQAETIVSILIEFHKFWAYENREAIVIETNPDETPQNV